MTEEKEARLLWMRALGSDLEILLKNRGTAKSRDRYSENAAVPVPVFRYAS